MRVRRPERFSDSVVRPGNAIDRSVLEYHLATLTSRNQEADFEEFARHLAEQELCPNLLPHTGPTGGGDSQVDAETYPVADGLSLKWYVGVGREAAAERWAFAFSAKKEWRAKVREDIAKIAGTERGYVKAFFISSQYIRDKSRSQTEDELSQQYGLDVRILDRSWILDKVFGNGHEDLAIRDLRFQGQIRTDVLKGPLDAQRERDLEDCETRISAAVQAGHLGLPLVDDCIEAATLARELERSREDVDGRFARADRVARKYGTPHQQLDAVYEWAWTTFWWYEDVEQTARLYSVAEVLAKGTRNAHDLELLQNLWFLLLTAVRSGSLVAEEVSFEDRSTILAAELDRLAGESGRPSTALQGRTMRLLQRLALAQPAEAAPIFEEMQEVIKKSEGLVGYPLQPLVEILTELGGGLAASRAYERVFELAVSVSSRREGEIVAARMLLKRAVQQLEGDRPYEAIGFAGRALGRLHKEESRNDLIRALRLCGAAYEQVGLLWAARGATLAAASLATNEFWAHSDVTVLQAACYRSLKWLELRLGRVPHLLAWHELDHATRNVLAQKGHDPEKVYLGQLEYDAILGALLLNAEVVQLSKLAGLPAVLRSMDLGTAAAALMYALGHEAELTGLVAPDAEQGLHAFFLSLRDQPISEALPSRPLLYDGPTVALGSSVLGCRVVVESENRSPCVELAESILAALESILSTALGERVVSREPLLKLTIAVDSSSEWPFSFVEQLTKGRPVLRLRCLPFSPSHLSPQEQVQIKGSLVRLLLHIMGRVFVMENVEGITSKLFDEELAIQRSIDFTGSFVSLGNVLGARPKTGLSDWTVTAARKYPPLRLEPWDAADPPPKVEPRHARAGGPARALDQSADLTRAAHPQMTTISLISEPLWNQAGWLGTAFAVDPTNEAPPILALLFRNGDAAKRIFEYWRAELGPEDAAEKLRICIIRGINKAKPYAYRVVIGANPKASAGHAGAQYLVLVSRANTMDPSTNRNLSAFLGGYGAKGRYLLAHAVLPEGARTPQFVVKNGLVKRKLWVREAWEIGRNDEDAGGIHEDDDPIVPAGHEDAPVNILLSWLRQRRRS